MKYILYIIATFFIGHSALSAQDADCEETHSLKEVGVSDFHSTYSEGYSYHKTYSFAYQNPFENEWTVGPNPTYGEVNVYGNLENINSIELYSITGELLQIKEGFDIFTPLDLFSYKSGIYLIRIVSITNEVKTYKLIKR